MAQEKVWHNLSVEEVFKQLNTSKRGLTNAEAAARLQIYGPNELEEEKKTSKLALLVRQLKSPLVGVLAAAALISFFVEKYIDMTVILVVIALNAAIGFFQEYKAEAALQALKTMAAPEAEVIRDCPETGSCIEMRVKTMEIVPGDVIDLDAGAKVPADARIFEAINLEIDESMLTGESIPVKKTVGALPKDLPVADRANMAFSGTIVTRGRGKAVVVATGMKTEIGKIAKLIKETEKAETPIQKQTVDLSKKLGLLALLASGLILIISLLRGFEFLEAFLFVLAAAVSAIPEGLPVVITITLAIGVHRMAKRNAIIRRLQAVDTLGSATVICTDKTGTLTTNQMTTQQIFVNNKLVKVTGVGYTPEGHFEIDGAKIDAAKEKALGFLLRISALCNDARLRRHKLDGKQQWEIYGDTTEGALVVAAAKAGLQKDDLEAKYPRVDEIPFDPKSRYMVTFHKISAEKLHVYVKGAPETILERCAEILEDGKAKRLTQQRKEEILAASTQMASEALRVLAIAYASIDTAELEDVKAAIQRGRAKLVFVGLAGMLDPPRPEAKSAVQLCKKAGIKVMMATGDHKLTAEAIAKEIGILESGHRVLTGTDLESMSDDELDAVINETAVFARVSPTHKYRIVESLRRKGHIVAMTGDGVNDAPALKAAEIGVAMGITGTDVTKETADMVLTDDNFASIVNAVEEGRVVFENIRKVVKYLVSTNTGEIITVIAALVLLPGVPLIFTPVQILWVNLVTDGLLDKFLAMEPKEKGVMEQPPRKPKERIINRDIMLNIAYVGLFMAIGTLWIFTMGYNSGGLQRAQTLAFTTIAMFQVFNALNCRSRTTSVFKPGLTTNKYLLGGIAASVSLQVLATLLPPLQTALGTISLSPVDWLLIILVSSSVLFADEIRKLVRSKVKKVNAYGIKI
ncbi:MAG: HAD-IC family P-type ATPase [Candidatus Bathyarchaeota archaeon]|nr:HAD-IC family P-type ATPase [Candidatus Bathyarchaeota archaeon]